jgi:hypothetical protein
MASKGGRMPESHEPGDLHFHYNREDREAMLSEETKRVLRKSKLFTMNRRNMIILADIAVILLFTMIFAPIVLGGKSNAAIDGFRTNLKAYEYDGLILVSLRVETKKDNPQESGLVSAAFSLNDEENRIEEIDLLPSEALKPRVLRAEFKATDLEKTKVFVSIDINGTKRNLSTTVKKE